MGKIRFYLALWLAKLSIIVLKITRHRGTNFPGIVALKVCPNFLRYVNKPKKIIAVTGTNGKTTVNNLIIDMLTNDNKKVLNNNYGSNINTGIATSLINGVNLFNCSKYEIASFEIDERSAVRVYPFLTPDYILVTNLSRDSIMRNAHPEYISSILTKYIPKSSKLILNADDLISSNISPLNKRVYYGLDKMDTDVSQCINIINDVQICPKCNSKLKYNYLRYHHIGNAYCPSCGFKSPKYDYKGSNVNLDDMTIDITYKKEKETFKLLNNGVHNIYNVLSAVVVLKELGYDFKKIKSLLEKISIVESRFNETIIDNKKIVMLLSKDKNAFGITRSIDYATHFEGNKQFILMMNCQHDEIEWSENVCWLYDCDFEFLNRDDVKKIIATGPRYKDYKLRLLFAGIDSDKVKESRNELDAPSLLDYDSDSTIFILYGTDSIDLAGKVKEKVISKIKEGMNKDED